MRKSLRNFTAVTRVGLDLAKNAFQTRAVDVEGAYGAYGDMIHNPLLRALPVLRLTPRGALAGTINAIRIMSP